MYGNLKKIDVSSLLNFISKQQRNGIFFIETESPNQAEKNVYFIFFYRGYIVFAGDKHSFDFQRIKDYLVFYNLSSQFDNLQQKLSKSASIAEYEAILLLGNKQLISSQEQKEICSKIIVEIIFQIINLKTGRFIWQDTFNLQPLIVKLKVEEVLNYTFEQNVEWAKMFPYISKIESCPQIVDVINKELLPKKIPLQIYKKIDGNTSLIQLSRYLNDSLINISKILFPYIRKGVIKLDCDRRKDALATPFNLPLKSQILYFSVNNEWNLQVSKLSSSLQYNFLIPDNLSHFFTYIFNLPIKLVILESETDNNYNTYNLCKLIKNNYRTANLPVIMVVNKYTFKDNLIAKMHGVTEYIGKNIFHKKMSQIIDKYL